MSKQTGLIKIKGKLGGVSFYRKGDTDFARMANGPDKDRISRDPAFARTRENNQEFGGAAMAAKAFRLALGSVVKRMAGKQLVQRTTKLFKEINRRGTGVRGQRGIKLSENHEMVNSLELNTNPVFSSIFHVALGVVSTVDRSGATISFAQFDPGIEVNAPSSATHFKLVCVLGLVSDFIFDSEAMRYTPENDGMNSLNVIIEGAMMSVSDTIAAFDLVLSLDGAPTVPAELTAVVGLGIEFYQRIGTGDYKLSQGNCMKLVAVF